TSSSPISVSNSSDAPLPRRLLRWRPRPLPSSSDALFCCASLAFWPLPFWLRPRLRLRLRLRPRPEVSSPSPLSPELSFVSADEESLLSDSSLLSELSLLSACGLEPRRDRELFAAGASSESFFASASP